MPSMVHPKLVSKKIISQMVFSNIWNMFSRILEYLFAANPAGVIAGDVNYDLSKVSSKKLISQMIAYTYILRL